MQISEPMSARKYNKLSNPFSASKNAQADSKHDIKSPAHNIDWDSEIIFAAELKNIKEQYSHIFSINDQQFDKNGFVDFVKALNLLLNKISEKETSPIRLYVEFLAKSIQHYVDLEDDAKTNFYMDYFTSIAFDMEAYNQTTAIKQNGKDLIN